MLSTFPRPGSLAWVNWQAPMWAFFVHGMGGDVATFWLLLGNLHAGIGTGSFQLAASAARWRGAT